MSSDVDRQPATKPEDLSQHPLPRDARCPFDPAPALQELQRSDGLTSVEMPDGTTSWIATRHEDARRLLRDPRVSADPGRPGYPHTVAVPPPAEDAPRMFIHLDEPEHSQKRRMVTPPLTIKNVRARQPELEATINGLIDDMIAGPNPTDFVEAFALPLPSIVICDLLGSPYDEREIFQETARVLVHQSATVEQRQTAMGELGAYLADLLIRKSREPGDDLYSQLWSDHVATGEISVEEAVGMGLMLLIAGHETTANQTALGLLTLFEHPEQRNLIQSRLDDPEAVGALVEELMRHQTIVREPIRRAVLEDIEHDGQLLRAGDGLMVPLDIVNRDPDVFASPDVFDPSRNARPQLGFGFGVHQCVGQQLARAEMTLAFTLLLRRLPDLALAVPFDELRFKTDSLVYGVDELPVRW